MLDRNFDQVNSKQKVTPRSKQDKPNPRSKQSRQNRQNVPSVQNIPRTSKKTVTAVRNHPDHSVHLARLRRIKGQLEGIEKMIFDQRYCTDIINQLKAAASALRAVEAEIFKTHLRGCVRKAFDSKDAFDSEAKIEEIVKMVY